MVAVFVEDEAAPEDGGAGWGGWSASEEPESGARGLDGGVGSAEGVNAKLSEPIESNVQFVELG